MKTLIFTIENAVAGGGYPLHISLERDTPEWWKTPQASVEIPLDLGLSAPPVEPINNTPLVGTGLRDAFLNAASVSPRFEAIGQYLFQLLNQGDVGVHWEEARNEYPGENSQYGEEGLRTILSIKPALLSQLPWELMRDGAQTPFFSDPLNPWMRGHVSFSREPKVLMWPLRALIVVGCRENDSAVQAEDEVANIEGAFRNADRKVEWEVLFRPTREELVNEFLRHKPHIFHFIGHGQVSLDGDYPVLEFSRAEAGGSWEWSATDIAVDLRGWRPQLAFINACRSNSAAQRGWAISEAFVKARVAAVIGMQADVSGVAAARLAGQFYENLVKGLEPDRALALARQSAIASSSLSDRNWAVASLHLSVSPDQVLHMHPYLTPELHRLIIQDEQLGRIRDFVDRKMQRYSLRGGVDPLVEEEPYRDLLVVTGEAEVGKTSLVRWCMLGCALRGRKISYIDLADDRVKDFLDVLRLIRDGDVASPSMVCKPLDSETFRLFNWIVQHLLDDREPPEFPQNDVSAGRSDGGKNWTVGDDSTIRRICLAFREALQKAAAGQPLVIVLDHLSPNTVRKDHFQNYLLPYLIAPIAGRQLPPIRMILVTASQSSEEYRELRLADLYGEPIEVPLLGNQDFAPLAKEFCLHHPKVDQAIAHQIIDAMALKIGYWKPKKLRDLIGLLS